MLDKSLFDPEKISIVDFKMVKGQVETPEAFIDDKVIGHHLENTFRLSFNLEAKRIKADYTIEIRTDSQGINKTEAIGNFHLMFIFQIENLADLVKLDKDEMIALAGGLDNALASITYSTSRGILLTRLQGSAFKNFILPVIDPNKLLHNQ